MMKRKKQNRKQSRDKFKVVLGIVLTVLVAITLLFFALGTTGGGEAIGMILIAVIILFFLIYFFVRRYNDVKAGMPYEDERSKRVMEKAGATTFFVSIYLLLAVGWLSEGAIQFRDVSQATGVSIGIMAVLFFVFWAYYSKKLVV